jgi:hypothetical protein
MAVKRNVFIQNVLRYKETFDSFDYSFETARLLLLVGCQNVYSMKYSPKKSSLDLRRMNLNQQLSPNN